MRAARRRCDCDGHQRACRCRKSRAAHPMGEVATIWPTHRCMRERESHRRVRYRYRCVRHRRPGV